MNCPICQSVKYSQFFEIKDIPVQDGILWHSQEEAFTSLVGDIKLAFCKDCGYIGNFAFEPEKVRYDSDYNFSLHYSSIYQNFINNLTNKIVRKYSLVNKSVLEIGCGQGDFLHELCKLGIGHGIGIDPALKSEVMEQNYSGKIYFIKDYYSEKYTKLRTDMIFCRHVLNHLFNPKAFIEMLRHNLDEFPNTLVYFEMPNAFHTFREGNIWNFIYERYSLFSPYSISQLFKICGFKVVSSGPCYGGQYLNIVAVPGNLDGYHLQSRSKRMLEMSQYIEKFQRDYPAIIKLWKERIEFIKEHKKNVIAWGAGGPAINFLSTLQIREIINYVVDINPLRQGQYLPKTGQLVVPPDFVKEFKPDVVIITNATYEKEIKKQISDLGLNCEFLIL